MLVLRRAGALFCLTVFTLTFAAPPARKPSAKRPAARSAVAQRWLRSLSLRDRVAQLVIVPCYGEAVNTRSRVYRKYVHEVRDLHVGGLIVLGHVRHGLVDNAEPYAMAAFLNRLQKLARIPLLAGADFEHGAAMRVKSATPWPQNMAFAAAGDIEAAREEGAATARDARALGIQWIFAPVADVNSNPLNPIINIRSYGENPDQVSRFVTAFIEGAHSDPHNPVLIAAKHFPGHGNTSVDSHMGLARNDETREQLETIDLPPFRAAIAAGADAIMTAHMAVPAIETQDIPSTVSYAVLTGLLRDDLKFKGIVVTDALDMQGITNLYSQGEAAVRALEAGADVLLMPKSPEAAIRGVVAAVKSGRISRKRLDASVLRILEAKARVGLARSRTVNLDHIADVLNAPEDDERALKVAEKAVTLVKDDGKLLPLRRDQNACLTVLAEGRRGQEGPHLIDEFKSRFPGMKTQLLDPSMSDADLQQAAAALNGCQVNIVAAYVTIAEYRGNTALAGGFPAFLHQLASTPAPVILVSLGSPYLGGAFPEVKAYVASYSTVPVTETAVAEALAGEIGFAGKLPVTIPGLAKYGEGITLEASNAASKESRKEQQ
jgi:beta-N-acetylhexosaminidase